MNVSFEYYKVFYHVARLGSITLAAKALFLSQPAVSKCIRQLEKVLRLRVVLSDAQRNAAHA